MSIRPCNYKLWINQNYILFWLQRTSTAIQWNSLIYFCQQIVGNWHTKKQFFQVRRAQDRGLLVLKLLQFFILHCQWILGIVKESSFYLPLTMVSILKGKIKSRLIHTFQKSFSGTFRDQFYDQYSICCTVINRIYTRNCFLDFKTMKWIPVSFIGILIRIQRFFFVLF